MPCRINKRREWTARLMLEAQCHESLSFLTLTYDDEHLPADGSLSIRDYQLFLKRLRKSYNSRLRYFLVGEYGDKTLRPHYHLVLFGIALPARGRVIHSNINWLNDNEKLVVSAWPNGNVHVGYVNEQSLAYCCKHLTKGLRNDYYITRNLLPEFCRQSRRPAIGTEALSSLIEFCTTDIGSQQIAKSGKVPSTIRFGNRKYQIGRTLRNHIAAEIGFDTGTYSAETIRQMSIRALERWESLGESGIRSARLSSKVKAHNIFIQRSTRL